MRLYDFLPEAFEFIGLAVFTCNFTYYRQSFNSHSHSENIFYIALYKCVYIFTASYFIWCRKAIFQTRSEILQFAITKYVAVICLSFVCKQHKIEWPTQCQSEFGLIHPWHFVSILTQLTGKLAITNYSWSFCNYFYSKNFKHRRQYLILSSMNVNI